MAQKNTRCYSYYPRYHYLPVPPRAWSRVQSPCTYVDPNYGDQEYVYIPILSKFIPLSQVPYELAVLYKGNVLQYKSNGSGITQQQRYSQIAKGYWCNRNKTYATQGISYSDPNTKSLKRVNYSTVTLNGVPVNGPVTCVSQNGQPIYSILPVNPGSNIPKPPLPPPPPVNQNPVPIPNNVAGPVIPQVVIADGGNLICTITENICTGEILASTSVNYCVPTSASDVPGPIIELCYNDGFLPTYYPRQNLTQASSGGDKFPEGYKGFVSALHEN